MAPLSEQTVKLIADKNMDKESPILVRVFKEESELEVWKQTRDGQYALLKTYPICKWSGDLGPKKKEGDRQAPEGFYTITPGQMNPNSNYYLAFNTGFPNAYDRSHGYTGSELMVHGDCSSRGCYAMTDEQIQEIYALARDSFFGGQKSFQFEAFPFRMTALNMAKHRNNPNFAFWKMLKEGYDNFEATQQAPQVAVCEQRYLFDQVDKDGKPLEPRNARAAMPGATSSIRRSPTPCSTIAATSRSRWRNYIGEGVAVAAAACRRRRHEPGLRRQARRHSRNTTRAAASFRSPRRRARCRMCRTRRAPRFPARRCSRRRAAPTALAAAPAPSKSYTLASTPMPEPSPRDAQPKRTASSVGLRGTNTELAAKPRRMTTAEPREVAKAPAPSRQTAEAQPPAKANADIRTAYSAPSAGSLIAGAQPTVPVGSFDSRWTGLR